MQRFAVLAAGAVSAAVAVVAAVTAAGLFRCYGDSCSYELRGYPSHGPGAVYGVMGGAAALLALTALMACCVAFSRRLRPALASLALALVLGGTAAFAAAMHAASA